MSALTIALPIWLGGFRQTVDMQSHLHFVHAFRAGIFAGDLYPGWANDNLGFGSVGIRFYPPVTAFVSAVLQLLLGDWHAAFSLSMFLWMLVGCFGMYLFVREWSSPVQGILAGVLYSVVPYHLAQVYRFFLYAEFAAMAAVPFCLLYLTRLCRRGNWGDLVPLAASCSVLALTHIPLTLMMAFSMLVYIPIAIDRRRWKKVSFQLMCSVALVVGATAFYWIRVVTELQWVSHADARYTTAGYEHGPMLFPYLLVDYDITYEAPILRHLDIVTVLTTALLIPSLVVLIARSKSVPVLSARVLAAATWSAVFGVFMFSKPSEFLWSGFSIFQRLQYPWRWLAVVSALAVVSISLSLPLLVKMGRISRRTALFGAVFLIVGFAVVDIKQIHGTGSRISAAEFNNLSAEVRSQRVAEHWWPAWAKPEAFQISDRVTTEHPRTVEIIEWESEQRSFTVGQGEMENLRVATFYYPYWRAAVNGREAQVGRDVNGAITIPVDKEPARVDLRFEEPIPNRIAGWSSFATWIFFLGFLAYRSASFGRRIFGVGHEKAAVE